MIIRDGRTDDLPAILAIYNELIATTNIAWTEAPQILPEREEWFDQRQQRGFPVLAADHDHEVIGFASYGDFRDSISKPGYRFTVEHSIAVRSDRHRAGVGAALLGALIERARISGVHTMVGGIDAENEPSFRLHERFGFVEVARMPETGFKFGRWLDLVLVQLIIDAPGSPR